MATTAEGVNVWNIILFGILGVRKRWVFWIAIPVSLLLMLQAGFKDAGSYAGYKAGSILSPNRYQETASTIIWGEANGLSANRVNSALSKLRGENMGAFICYLLLLLLFIVAAYAVSYAYANAYLDIDDVLDNDDARAYFIGRYEAVNGKYLAGGFPEDPFRFKLANFVYDLCIAENWQVLLADAPASFRTEVAAPIQVDQDETLGKVLKFAM